VRLRGGSVRV
jgi:hypothetical protein